MADTPQEPHKRSKSKKIANSLLGRHSHSKGEGRDSEDSESLAPPSQTNLSVASAPASRNSINLSHRSKSHGHPVGTTSAPTDADVVSSVAGSNLGDGSASPPDASSLEQSVKLFGLYQALQSGNTTAIQKAIKDADEETASGRTASGVANNSSTGKNAILRLAVQIAEPAVIEFVLSNIATSTDPSAGINARDKDGNTPLHLASKLGRPSAVRMLLQQPEINDALANYKGETPLEVAKSPEIFQQLQLFRSLSVDADIRKIHDLVVKEDYDALEKMLKDPRVKTTISVNDGQLATDPTTQASGGSLLHEGARKRDIKLIQLLLLNGADPFQRDRKGKLPQDVTKDDRTRAILKKSPAANEARQGIQERTILGSAPAAPVGTAAAENALGNKEGREMKGYLKKWTNYTGGWKLRWFVLEDGVLSYYKNQDDAGSACRGAINMRIAKLQMDPSDKSKIDIHGKSSVKYNLKANHEVEAKRWFWALNNAMQYTKDEAKEEELRLRQESVDLLKAKQERAEKRKTSEIDASSMQSSMLKQPVAASSLSVPGGSIAPSTTVVDEEEPSVYAPSVSGTELGRRRSTQPTIEGDGGDDDYGDEASSTAEQPETKDALNITTQSVKLQLDFLAQVSAALQQERATNPELAIGEPKITQALTAYESSVDNLKGLVGKLVQISRDRDAYLQYRLEREANVRRMWEESMAKVVQEHEELEQKIGESEDKRKRTKRALNQALENLAVAESQPSTPSMMDTSEKLVRKKTVVDLSGVPEDDSDDEDEFFDAVGTGDVEIMDAMPPSSPGLKAQDELPSMDGTLVDLRTQRKRDIEPSFRGYEDGIRKRLKMDADDRPKVGLWGILKSMIGKDMTKMTLPVSFNEPTSLLQRVAEDMEYTDLLDIAADRLESTERMVYVAAFAASEYASTIGRVAKPFNPLLGETYEYARPDKGFRFFIEQVSHHPPIGAAWAESANWDYYGESAVKSKFYGKSFDINPLGTWFLKLRPTSGGEELYTWKKLTSSVIGIVTGNPTVDNYGLMEVKNWTTGEVCTLDFKARGWTKGSAFQVVGKVCDKAGKTCWSMGGRWNEKIYARLTPGFEDGALSPSHPGHSKLGAGAGKDSAILVWQANARPTGIPFNLTPFVVTLNDINENLSAVIAPTDTRLRPDQRAMEDGEYDFAATEKNRVEEKQRAARRVREQMGKEFKPKWFEQKTCPTTGEKYWQFSGEYWRMRNSVANGGKWEGLEDIF
ncbi:oxysterol binding protein [Venturia nashicola]|nr:oxysterol binding protein [Venturia nashicola]